MCPRRGSGPTGPNSIGDLGEVSAGMVVDEHRHVECGGQVHKRKEVEDTESLSDVMDRKLLEKRAKQDKEHEKYMHAKNLKDLEKSKELEKEKKIKQSKKDQEKVQIPKVKEPEN